MLQDTLVFLVLRRPVFSANDARARATSRSRSARPTRTASSGRARPSGGCATTLAFAAQSSHHVLVQGDSGSGKELAARAIHALSSRQRGPFVTRNAATLPEGLVDAELFGTVRGYPHAGSPERRGVIGEADGGTLFLDEIGELRHDLQAHLLRVLDHGGEYQRLGDARTRRSTFAWWRRPTGRRPSSSTIWPRGSRCRSGCPVWANGGRTSRCCCDTCSRPRRASTRASRRATPRRTARG